MANEPYKIKLRDIFEGPMDLLVHLIKKNEVDIYDIPIAFITDQFLEYLEWMKSMDVDIAGDFLVMAATLTHLKSRMLLPSRYGADNSDEDDDPRKEISGPLLEYMHMKSVAEQLSGQPILDEDIFSRKVEKSEFMPDPSDETIQADLLSLFAAYHSLLDKMTDQKGLHITFERISVKEKMTEIIDLIKEKGAVAFDTLLSDSPDRSEIIVTFLAILEIVKLNMARLMQTGPYSNLRLIFRESADANINN